MLTTKALTVFCAAFLSTTSLVRGLKFGADEDSEDFVRYFLNRRFLDSELYHQELESITDSLKGSFPILTPSQKQFAVNPSYKSFYDSRYRDIEGVDDFRKSKEQEETEVPAEDPLAPNPVDKIDQALSALGAEIEEEISPQKPIPKKAALDALEGGRVAPLMQRLIDTDKVDDVYFTTIVAVSSALAVFAVVGAGFCYYRVQRNAKAAEEVEYPAYGVTGPGKETSPTSGGDRKLAQSAQMYHYQHQKQQMIAFDTSNNGSGATPSDRRNGAASDCESEEEGDYTVYECPGLAPTGEMEVRNPLFQDDPTPKAAGKH